MSESIRIGIIGDFNVAYRGSTGGRVNTVDMAPAIAQVLLRINESDM